MEHIGSFYDHESVRQSKHDCPQYISGRRDVNATVYVDTLDIAPSVPVHQEGTTDQTSSIGIQRSILVKSHLCESAAVDYLSHLLHYAEFYTRTF